MYPFATRMMAASGAAASAGSTFNPADKSNKISLSADLLTATHTTTEQGFFGVRGTQSRSGGKLYAEFVDGTASGAIGNEYGLASAAYELGDAYYDASSLFWYNGGQIYQSSTKKSDVTPMQIGGVLGIAWDVSGGTVAFYRNGSLASTITGYTPAKPMFLFFAGTGGGNGKLRTLASQFTRPIPSGFTPWG